MIFFRWICEFFSWLKAKQYIFFYAGDFFFGRILPLEFSIFFFLRKKILRTFFVKTFFSLIKWNRVKRNVRVLFCCPQVSLKKQKWTDKYTQRAHQSLFFVFVKTELLIISLWCFRILKEPTKYFLGEIKFVFGYQLLHHRLFLCWEADTQYE